MMTRLSKFAYAGLLCICALWKNEVPAAGPSGKTIFLATGAKQLHKTAAAAAEAAAAAAEAAAAAAAAIFFWKKRAFRWKKFLPKNFSPEKNFFRKNFLPKTVPSSSTWPQRKIHWNRCSEICFAKVPGPEPKLLRIDALGSVLQRFLAPSQNRSEP